MYTFGTVIWTDRHGIDRRREMNIASRMHQRVRTQISEVADCLQCFIAPQNICMQSNTEHRRGKLVSPSVSGRRATALLHPPANIPPNPPPPLQFVAAHPLSSNFVITVRPLQIRIRGLTFSTRSQQAQFVLYQRFDLIPPLFWNCV